MANTIATSPGVAVTPHGEAATSANYRTAFDYSNQFDADTFTELYPQYGNGKITSFCNFMGMEKPFESDVVIWAEQGRLHQIIQGATISGDSIDCGSEEHNLRVGDIIWLSNGTVQYQADVYAITDANNFDAHLRSATGSFSTSGTYNIFKAGSEFAKKTDNFTQGRNWDPEIKQNYPQIIKEFYDVPKSDMAQITWLQNSKGTYYWYQEDWERTRMAFENEIELTNVFNYRAVASSAANTAGKRGMDGIVPQLESGGNVGNGNIDSLGDVDDITKRLRKQGQTRTFMIWADQLQMIDFNNMLDGVNSHFAGGRNYGLFNNSEDLALHLDFVEFYRNGFYFDLTRFDALDDPTLFGDDNFLTTGVGSLIVPASEKTVTENGQSVTTPYLCVRKRKNGNIDRSLEVKILGTPENPIANDSMQVHYLTEMTNQVVGANEWMVNYR